MLYEEFVKGTGCRQTDYNFKVYKNLEILYMNSDMSKAEIYEYGKKLVNNDKTPQEIEFEEGIKAEIEKLKYDIAVFRADAERASQLLAIEDDPFWKKKWRSDRDYANQKAKECRNKIKGLKWVLE